MIHRPPESGREQSTSRQQKKPQNGKTGLANGSEQRGSCEKHESVREVRRVRSEGSRANMNRPLGYQVNPPDLVNSVSLTRLTPDKQLNLAGEESVGGLAAIVPRHQPTK